MELAKTVRRWFASKVAAVGTVSIPVGLHHADIPTANNVTTPEERDEVMARGELIQEALKKQLGGPSGA
jgi:hypothetical protein